MDRDPPQPQQYMSSGAGAGGPPPPYGHQPTVPKYVFTPDELRALKECNRESFYYRCLPLGTFLSGAVFYAIKAGYIKGSSRWGPSPKMFLAATAGYIIGKFSYQKKCVEKILALPNSPLAEMIRKNKQGGGSGIGFTETLSLDPSFSSVTSGSGYTGGDMGDSRSTESSLFTDVGDSRPMDSFDNSSSTPEYYAKSDVNEQQMENMVRPKTPQHVTSYDELRKQNREEYDRRIHPPSSPYGGLDSQRRSGSPTSTQYQVGIHERERPSLDPQAPLYPGPPTGSGKKNQYGDSWD